MTRTSASTTTAPGTSTYPAPPSLTYNFVNNPDFAYPLNGWSAPATVIGATLQADGRTLTLTSSGGPVPQFYFLTPSIVQMRFNAQGNYSPYASYALADTPISAPVTVTLNTITSGNIVTGITADTDTIKLLITYEPYSLTIYDSKRDVVVYEEVAPPSTIPGAGSAPGIRYVEDSVICYRDLNPNSQFCGFGEKAGTDFFKNGQSMTFFNYDQFQAPNDDSVAMYISVPLLIEYNTASPYCIGLFMDNPGQSYFDCGSGNPNASSTTLYSGVLYGDLNTYIIFGRPDALGAYNALDVVQQYTALTGTIPVPPKYVLGYHQGCYGYLNDSEVMAVINSYRSNDIPLDGLHLDIVFQHNYCTFTTSQRRYGNLYGSAAGLMNEIHANGVKCSTNITSMVNRAPNFYLHPIYVDEGSEQPACPQANPPVGTNPGEQNPFQAQKPQDPSEYDIDYTPLSSGQDLDIFVRDAAEIQQSPFPLFVGEEDYGDDLEGNALSAAGYYPDLTNPNAQTWWGQQYAYLIQTVGLDMVWQDMTDPAIGRIQIDDNTGDFTTAPNKSMPLYIVQYDFGRYSPHAFIHNAWALSMVEWTYKGITQSLRPDKRLFIIARGGYAGTQKYAGVWTGDSGSDWMNYQRNIPMVLNLGLSGIAIAGSDIPGFADGDGDGVEAFGSGPNNYIVTPELYMRWFSAAAYLPWFRNHYDGYTKLFQEPYLYDDGVRTIARQAVETRYRLLQYLYDAAWTCYSIGTPIARPMFVNMPTDVNTYNAGLTSQATNGDPVPFVNRQCFIGDWLLVAPVVNEGQTSSVTYLPSLASSQTQWYFWNGDNRLHYSSDTGGAYLGGTQAYITAPPGIVPVFVREGAILPMRALEQYVGELAECPLSFNIYPSQNTTTYNLYLDDGTTLDYAAQHAYRQVLITAATSVDTRTVVFQRLVDNYTPAEPAFTVRVLSTQNLQQATVTLNGTSLPFVADPAALDAATAPAFCFDANTSSILVKVFDNAPTLTVAVTNTSGV